MFQSVVGQGIYGEQESTLGSPDYMVCEEDLNNVKSLYNRISAFAIISRGTKEWFQINVAARQGCLISPWWLFGIFMDGALHEIRARWGDVV